MRFDALCLIFKSNLRSTSVNPVHCWNKRFEFDIVISGFINNRSDLYCITSDYNLLSRHIKPDFVFCLIFYFTGYMNKYWRHLYNSQFFRIFKWFLGTIICNNNANSKLSLGTPSISKFKTSKSFWILLFKNKIQIEVWV